MRVTVIAPPSAEPVSLTEAKDHLRVDASDEDALISGLISAAREWVEAYCNRAIGLQTLEIQLPHFSAVIELPRPVFRSLDSIKYLDTDGVEQTLASTVYRTIASSDAQPAVLELISGQGWPSVTGSLSAVRIRYQAGWDTSGSPGDVVPEGIKQAILMVLADYYEHREAQLDAQVHENLTVQRLLAPFRVYA